MRIGTPRKDDLSGLEHFKRQLDLDWDDVAEIVGVDRSTLHRWLSGEASPQPLAWSRLAEIGDVLQALHRTFAGPDLAREWLRSARPKGLGGRSTPLEIMKAGRIDRVLGLLQSLGRGA